MHQIVENIRTGKVRVAEVPDPMVRLGHVLIANECSVISAGTEKMVMELAQKSLLGKARERPDQVRRVIEKLRTEGLFSTLAQVRERLDEPMAMGYSSAGIVLTCGAGVREYKPGDRVASNGPHAGVVCVPKHLCARIPDGVSRDHAAFTVLGAIALQSVRLARVDLGAVAYVIGLGLVGQLTVALLKAAGCRVLATDLDARKCELARSMGADEASPALNASAVTERTGGLGADAVLITASSKFNGPIELAVEAVRKKGRIVLVGVVGLELDRRPFYFKECEFVVSCSYGPGRYDPEYEDRGRDYPAAYVRWTEQRNMQAVLDQMAAGRLDVSPLITHRFPIERAAEAYELIEKGTEPYLGIVLEYPSASLLVTESVSMDSSGLRDGRCEDAASSARTVLSLIPSEELSARPNEQSGFIRLLKGKSPFTLRRPIPWGPSRRGHPDAKQIGIGVLGAGSFARTVLVPAIRKDARLRPEVICSAGGLSAVHTGEKHGFASATTEEEDVFGNPNVGAVFSITRHDQHATQVVKALRAGKHIFVEKPLALSVEELLAIEEALHDTATTGARVMVGFNRRFAPASVALQRFFADVSRPLTVSIRFNAGALEADHWTQAEDIGGGRIIGEACHAVDLATFLAGSPPVRVFAESTHEGAAEFAQDDQCFITLRHANGAVSNIAYLAGGDKAFPKERVEVVGGGKIAVIDDFRTLTTCTGGKLKTVRLGRQDKGHGAEISAFADTILNGGAWPIPWEELRAVTLASILAVRSIREGVPFEVS